MHPFVEWLLTLLHVMLLVALITLVIIVGLVALALLNGTHPCALQPRSAVACAP